MDDNGGGRAGRCAGGQAADDRALTVLVAGLAAGVITPLITQATRLVADAPRYIDLLRGWVTDLQARYPALTDTATLINRFLE